MTGPELRSVREWLGLTQGQMARVVCAGSWKTVAQWEWEVRRPSGPVQMVYREIAGGWKPASLVAVEAEEDSR